MDLGGDVPAPSKVGLISGLLVILGLSIISAVSGVGRGVKYLSNLNLVLSIILLGTFVVFGSFLFAMTTYGSAMVDYILHYISLSFVSYGPLSSDAFTAALPAAAQLVAGDLMAGATNAWGSFDGFKSGLEGAAAELDEATLTSAYAAGEQGRQFGWQAGGRPSTGHGGSPSHLSLACSLRASPKDAPFVSLFWAASSHLHWFALHG